MSPRRRGTVRMLSPALGLICRTGAADGPPGDAADAAMAELAAIAEDAAVRAWIEELREVMARHAGADDRAGDRSGEEAD